MLPSDDLRPRERRKEPRGLPTTDLRRSDGVTLPRLCATYLLLCLYRMANALVIRTQFDPDEYWQTLEPAYCLAFASSSSTSPAREEVNCAYTWEWTRRWEDGDGDGDGDDHSDLAHQIPWLSKLLRGPVRSYVPVLPTAALYVLLRLLGLDTNFAVRRGPAVLHAILVAAPVDLAAFVMCLRAFPRRPNVASWALACSVSSWFHGYALVRTYANSIESALFAAGIVLVGDGLFGGDSHGRRGGGSGVVGLRDAVAFFLGGIAASVRFTALAGWVPLGLILAHRRGGTSLDKLRYVIHPCATCGALGIFACGLVDRLIYGFWTAPFLGSLHFNVLLRRGSLYGTHPWHWYVTAGLPAICGIMTPLLAYQMARTARRIVNHRHLATHGEGGGVEDGEETTESRNRLALLLLVWCYVGLHSFSEHKEFRFLLPVLPLVCVLSGDAVDELLRLHIKRPSDANDRHVGEDEEEEVVGDEVDGAASSSCKQPRQEKTGIPCGSNPSTPAVVAVGLVLFVFNVPHWAFLALIHQRGPIAVNEVISRMMIHGTEVRRRRQGDANGGREGLGYSVHYLMGCHSAPVFSHLHVPGVAVEVWSLDCSPTCRAATVAAHSSSDDSGDGDRSAVLCESDRFLHDPATFVASNYRLTPRMAKTGGGGVGQDSKGGEGMSTDAETTGYCGNGNGEDCLPPSDHPGLTGDGNVTCADVAEDCLSPDCVSANTGVDPIASPVLRLDPPDFLAVFENEVGPIEGLLLDRMGMERVANIRHSISGVRWRRPGFDVASSVVRVLHRTSWGAGVLTLIGLETSTAWRARGQEGFHALRSWALLDPSYEHVVLFAKRGIAAH